MTPATDVRNKPIGPVRLSEDEHSGVTEALASAGWTLAHAVRQLPALVKLVRVIRAGKMAEAKRIADAIADGPKRL